MFNAQCSMFNDKSSNSKSLQRAATIRLYKAYLEQFKVFCIIFVIFVYQVEASAGAALFYHLDSHVMLITNYAD